MFVKMDSILINAHNGILLNRKKEDIMDSHTMVQSQRILGKRSQVQKSKYCLIQCI